MPNNFTQEEDLAKLDYPGELTLEALAVIDSYIANFCNTSLLSRRQNKVYARIRYFLKQPFVRELFKLTLLRKGVTPEKIAQRISDGINATRSQYYEGEKIADEPDWQARYKFSQLACEIYEALKYVNKQDTTISVQNINITDEDKKRIAGFTTKILSRLDLKEEINSVDTPSVEEMNSVDTPSVNDPASVDESISVSGNESISVDKS